jgi:hypothetical protein
VLYEVTSQPQAGALIEVGPFRFDKSLEKLSKHGTPIRLRGMPLKILQQLVERPGEIVSRGSKDSGITPALSPSDSLLEGRANPLAGASGNTRRIDCCQRDTPVVPRRTVRLRGGWVEVRAGD